MTTIIKIAAELPGSSVLGNGDTLITGVTHDSRMVAPGFLFAALPGAQTDGRKFVTSALERGAAAVLTGEMLQIDAPQIVVSDPRRSLGPAAAVVYDHPTRGFALTGITGTNGKTTITYLLEAALLAAGAMPGVMGTVDYRFGHKKWKADHTTPEASSIQNISRQMLDAGASHMLMEVSSHGLVLDRLGGCEFDVVAFSNLTQDHLDFHGDMEKYGAAKMLLFTRSVEDNPKAKAVINKDDPFSDKILSIIKRPALTISCDPQSDADLRPTSQMEFGVKGISGTILTPVGERKLRSPMLGLHNLNNLLMALGICSQLSVDLDSALRGLSEFQAVPGRLERVPCSLGFTVLVDYAHTPDALHRALTAVRSITKGRLICVFGCGGDRDQAKRPIMGDAVARVADISIVTSDNPRTEDPEKIIEMILPGIVRRDVVMIKQDDLRLAKKGYGVIVDRESAIEVAISGAKHGDTVLIAGKGHEDYQIIGVTKRHFDDREKARDSIMTKAKDGDHD